MKLRCREAFGNFVPGDVIDVPEGAVYDTLYFELAEPDKTAPKEESK